MGVEGITSALVSPTKLIIRLPPQSKGVNSAPPALSPVTAVSPVTAMGAEGRKSVRISPMKFILRLPKSSNPKQQPNSVPMLAGFPLTALPIPVPVSRKIQVLEALPPSSSTETRISSSSDNSNIKISVKNQKGNGSLITAPTESIPAPTPITAQVPVAVPPKSSKPVNFDEKKAGEKLSMRYQEEAARKQGRKIQILAKAEVPLTPQPPSSSKQSSRSKRKISSCSSFSAPNGRKKQKGSSLIMKKARKEYINCLEVRNLASMASQKRMQLKTLAF